MPCKLWFFSVRLVFTDWELQLLRATNRASFASTIKSEVGGGHSLPASTDRTFQATLHPMKYMSQL